MVKSGEESGTLENTFMYLADYLDRMYEVISKAAMHLSTSLCHCYLFWGDGTHAHACYSEH